MASSKTVEEDFDKRIKAMLVAFQASKTRGLGKGHPGKGEVGCTYCGTGVLSYSVEASKGHMRGVCSTPGCLNWVT
jgi:redox-regulated HSP33 family molecular chaperone